jgi:N-acyl-D-aspartate/D-glutamate deacylase
VLDAKITGGMLIDGLGGTPRRADIGIAGGRIRTVGVVDDQAAKVIDATGLVIAPGFIDTHTHYDAQVSWDRSLAPSPLHGVTSVIGGNCGFTVAPIDSDAASYVERMLARVEGMPIEALTAGVPWNWKSFGDWLERIDTGLAVNAGFLVGHSTIRRVVMGARAIGDQAGEKDLARMVQLVDESLAAGALGLSSSRALSHHDGNGDPVPSRFASVDELVALAAVVGRHPGTVLALNPGVSTFDDGDVALMAAMSAAADRVLNWNALLVDSVRADAVRDALGLSDRVARAGGQVVAQVAADPRRFYLSFTNGFLLDTLAGWAPLFGLSPSARREALGDPTTRHMLRAGAENPAYGDALRGYTDWGPMTLVETTAVGKNGKTFSGRTIDEVAIERNCDPLDALLDLVVADDLGTVFTPPPIGDDDDSWTLRAATFCDPRAVIGASDAGAHLDVASSFTYTTSLLAGAVRRRRLLSLEEAVHQLTEIPRRVVGLRERGRVAPGWWADLVIFDPATVQPGPVHVLADLPGQARRLFAGATGIERVLVNGIEVVEAGRLTGEHPGRVLRSGRDTETMSVAAQAAGQPAGG